MIATCMNRMFRCGISSRKLIIHFKFALRIVGSKTLISKTKIERQGKLFNIYISLIEVLVKWSQTSYWLHNKVLLHASKTSHQQHRDIVQCLPNCRRQTKQLSENNRFSRFFCHILVWLPAVVRFNIKPKGDQSTTGSSWTLAVCNNELVSAGVCWLPTCFSIVWLSLYIATFTDLPPLSLTLTKHMRSDTLKYVHATILEQREKY